MFDLKKLRKEKKVSQKDLAEELGVGQSFISQMENGKDPVPKTVIAKLVDLYNIENISDYQIADAIKPITLKGGRTLIPYYDNVESMGGINEPPICKGSLSLPTEYINAGDWFKDATAAIRHYGESMNEYPPGCILVLKEVQERQLVLWGRDYVIETNEYRITKRLQRGEDEKSVMAYSTNEKTYSDGRLIYEPIGIQWNDINRLFIVLGYVKKKFGGEALHATKKSKKDDERAIT